MKVRHGEARRRHYPSRLGVLVNPIAGMGGRVGLKGTDGDRLERARELGALPTAEARAGRALKRLRRSGFEDAIVAAPGQMGETACEAAGLTAEPIEGRATGRTTAVDTASAAIAMAERGVRLLLFAGGDGTARDIHAAIGDAVPILGIPTGVKMHSGVFAPSPEAAGEAAALFLEAGDPAKTQPAELVDAEEVEDAPRPRIRVFGQAMVPAGRSRPLPAKASSAVVPGAAIGALCRQLVAQMDPDHLYIIGPGATAGLVKEDLGIAGAVAGVDAVVGGRLVAADASERDLLALLDRYPSPTVIAGVIGGQGYLFGRGNQQISASVLGRTRRADIVVISPEEKLLALKPQKLLVDTGDPAVDQSLRGYCHVRVAPGKTISIAVSN